MAWPQRRESRPTPQQQLVTIRVLDNNNDRCCAQKQGVEATYCCSSSPSRDDMDNDHSETTATTQHSFVNMLAALSFEKTACVLPTLPLRRKKKKKQKTKQQPLPQVVPVVDGDDDEVFFDALEYGDDSSNPNGFQKVPSSRESIVLAGITVDHQHRAVEAVLGDESSSSSGDSVQDDTPPTPTLPLLPPAPPTQLPLRFLRAGKNDPKEGLRRYRATLEMRATEHVDTILREPSPHYPTIKQYYPHYCHLRGKQNEPCFYEQPPRTNLKALRAAGITLATLMRHYTRVTEYQWQYLERDDLATSIYMIDLQGMRMTDFAGEAVEFLKLASGFSAQHYPERAGYVFVLNVPGWFQLIWKAVKPMIDETTLEKIYILRGKDEIRKAMAERIPLENIPPEYGGLSMPLGESPEEKTLAEWVEHNNRLHEEGKKACSGPCRFCQWAPARSY